MYRNSFLKQILLGLIIVLFASCDKDFNEIGSNIVDDDHFLFDKDDSFTVVAHNQKLGPVASNNLAINPLGIYNNPSFGTTTASFVTQLEMKSPNPIFTNIDNPPVIDSVILSVPYFNRFEKNDDGDKIYELDSVYGQNLSKFKLSIHESGYYLRDLDPATQLGEGQLFYSDKNAEIDSYKVLNRLNTSENTKENDEFFFDPAEVRENILNKNDVKVLTKTVPAMRLHLDKPYFTQKILNAPSGQLFNNNVFKNYFRGLYFKVESIGSTSGNMAMMDFTKGIVTVYYKQDNEVTVNEVTTVERLAKSFVLTMTGNTVSLQENSNQNANYTSAINSPNTTLGDEKLYPKGGEGSIAVIDLFGAVDVNKVIFVNPSTGVIVPDDDATGEYALASGSNGISDEIDQIKVNKWLINEANLTFYVDKSAMASTQSVEPIRVYLYDLNNNLPLFDFADGASNAAYPKLGKTTHGGILLKEDGTIVKQIRNDGIISNKGHKYKIRITNHVRNLIKNDSVNVRLGLSVTENINSFETSKLKTANTAISKLPIMSVISPVGTILYGNNLLPSNVNYAKRLKLEIYYTKPD